MKLLASPTVKPVYRKNKYGTPVQQWLVYAGTFQAPDGTIRGKKYYRNKEADAIALAKELARTVKKNGNAVALLSAHQLSDAQTALRMLSDASVAQTLTETVRLWLERKGGAVACDYELDCAIGEYLERFEHGSDHHITVKNTLVPLQLCFSKTNELTRKAVETHIQPYANPKSYNLKRGYILAFLNWAQKNGKCPKDMYIDCMNIETKKVPYRPPLFMHAPEVEKVMRWADAQVDADMLVPKLALSFFAGIRCLEIHRMTWRNVKFATNEIRVETPKGAKGVPPRIVTMQPNLKAWLLAHQCDDEFPVCYTEPHFDRRMAAMRKEIGVVMPRNVGRHTFATMHLAAWRAYSQTASDMGHSETSDMLKRKYANITDKEDAAAFWNIYPKKGN